MPITLPTGKLPPLTREPRNLLLYGRPKTGKSTLCATLPDSFHIDTQQGTMFLSTARAMVNSASELHEVVSQLRTHHQTKYPFRFLIIDIIDSLEDWSEPAATDYYKRQPVGVNFRGESVLELDRGAGYRYLRQEFRKMIIPVLANDLWHTVFVGHVRDKYSDGSKLESVVVEGDLDLTGKVKSIMCGLVDAIGYVYRDAMGTLKMTFATKDVLNCGNRAAHLAGKTFAFSTPPRPEEWAAIYPDTLGTPPTA